MKSRTLARCTALQVLYEVDIVNHPPGTVLQERLEEETALPGDLHDFVHKIVFGVLPLRETLDSLISEHAPEWPIDQVAIIDRNILRIALWELALYGETPLKVVINEAIEVAKLYGSDNAGRFVNGVLGALAERQNELRQSLRAIIQKQNKG